MKSILKFGKSKRLMRLKIHEDGLVECGSVCEIEAKGLFTPWTMKASQGPVKFVIGC
jgi:hypothetical protein